MKAISLCLETVVEDVQCLVRGLQWVSVKCVRRSGNKVAHALARQVCHPYRWNVLDGGHTSTSCGSFVRSRILLLCLIEWMNVSVSKNNWSIQKEKGKTGARLESVKDGRKSHDINPNLQCRGSLWKIGIIKWTLNLGWEKTQLVVTPVVAPGYYCSIFPSKSNCIALLQWWYQLLGYEQY